MKEKDIVDDKNGYERERGNIKEDE